VISEITGCGLNRPEQAVDANKEAKAKDEIDQYSLICSVIA
jgi:hypothetical protein